MGTTAPAGVAGAVWGPPDTAAGTGGKPLAVMIKLN